MLGLRKSQKVPLLLFRHESGKLVPIVLNIVDDIRAAKEGKNAKFSIERCNKNFELDTISSGPGRISFFDINTLREHDMTLSTDAEDKLNAFTEYAWSRPRLKQFYKSINELENFFSSLDSSLGWIGAAASPLCSFSTFYLQQKEPATKVSHMIEKQNSVRKPKRIGTIISYPRPNEKA